MGSSIARPTITPPDNTIDTPSHDQLITNLNSTIVLDDTLRFASVAGDFFQPLASSKSSVEFFYVIVANTR